MTKIARHAPRPLAGALFLTLSVLAFAGTTDPWMQRLGAGRLEAVNQAYLTASFNKAVAGFGVLSPLKAGLDVIEGSRVGASLGVTAQLEVGDLVQPAYDYVDIAWRTLLVGSATLLGIRYLLQATGLVDSLVLGFALLVAALVFFVRWLAPRWTQGRAVLRDVLSVSIVGVVAIYYLLPASVLGASYLSRIITAPAIEEAEQGFQQTREQLFPEEESAGGWGGRLKQLQERVERTADYLKVRAGDVVVWTVKLITGYVFDCIVFPLTLFLVLLWLTRSIMRYAFQRSFQRSFGEEMERVLAAREVR